MRTFNKLGKAVEVKSIALVRANAREMKKYAISMVSN